MLEKCKTVLLISEVASFTNMYKELAESVGVKLIGETSWNNKYRIMQDVVITGAKHLDSINKSYYPKTVLLLKPGESPAKYIKEGIERFIFDHQNQYELTVALFKAEPVVVHTSSRSVVQIVEDYGNPMFCNGDYDFRFDKDIYIYKDRPIYLCESQKKFLAQWLLAGHKDNKKRMTLCNLRKKFGEDFLRDVDRFGQMKED